MQFVLILASTLAAATQTAAQNNSPVVPAAGMPSLATQVAHGNAAISMDFSPDNRYIATAGGSVLLWNTARGELLRRFEEDDANVNSIDFSPDGRFLQWTRKPLRRWRWHRVAVGCE